MLNFIQRLTESVAQTNQRVFSKLKDAIRRRGRISDELIDDIEEILISGDVGVKPTRIIIDALREQIGKAEADDPDAIFATLKTVIRAQFSEMDLTDHFKGHPHVILVVGVNGVGKTTSIGKLTHYYKQAGKSVLLVAADTFRAAAIDQLQIWAQRNDVECVAHQEGSDPSAVAFDGVSAGKSRNADLVIIDTAGRLHNKQHLMDQLAKMKRVVQKVIPDAPHEVMIVLDATMGQNAVQQAKAFRELVDVDSIILTKLDGTAKGGVVIGIVSELNIPVKFVGIGEGIEDFNKFNANAFIDGILS